MPYPSDLTDVEWLLVADLFEVGGYGHRRRHEVGHLLNAVFYLNRTGCQWRYLPSDFPPWKTVFSFYNRAKKRGIWDQMLQRLVAKSRVAMGKNEQPTYALIDSQSVKTTSSSEGRGIDGGKKRKAGNATL
jgi:transposase